MIGSIIWNLATGMSGAALIFIVSYGHNPLQTAGMRSLYSFIILFLVTFAVRWLLGLAAEGQAGARTAADTPRGASDISEGGGESGTGQTVDLVTPPDDNDLLFTPLAPPKLASVKTTDAEQIAKTLRHMSEQ
jgi:hypothetical protein